MEHLFGIEKIDKDTDLVKLRKDLERHCLYCGTKSYSRPLCNPCYKEVHVWARKDIPKRYLCQGCHVSCLDKKLELANISQQYKVDYNDWEWLCRDCHNKKYKTERFLSIRRHRLLEELDNLISMKETGMMSTERIFKMVGFW